MQSPRSRIALLDRSKKRIWIALGVAVLLHLPATPAFPLMRMLHRFAARNSEVEQPKPQPIEVEVEMQQALKVEEQRQQRAAETEAKEEPNVSQASLSPTPTPPAPFGKATPPPSSQEEAVLEKAKAEKKLKDLGLEGVQAKKDDVKPGVALGLWLSSVRHNPLGKEVAALALCERQWRTFFEQGIDVLNDFDGVLIVGPSLSEPGKLTAAVRHSLPKERVHDVVDGLVKRSGAKGRWVKPDAALVRMGRESRMLFPKQEDLFFVAPREGWETLHRMKQPMRVPKAEGRLASLVLSKPNQLLNKVGLVLPSRITTLRLEAYVYGDLTGELKVELEDTNPKAAAEDLAKVSTELSDFFSDAWVIASTLSSVTGETEVPSGPELTPKLALSTQNEVIKGTAQLTAGQTRNTMSLIKSFICRKSKAPANAAAAPGSLAAKAK